MLAKALLVGAFAAIAAAQSSVLTFTRVPNPVTAGSAEAITYATNDTSSPVTIILRKGPSDDLQNVSTLTTTAFNGQYVWTPDRTLANGNDYALEIIQGSQFNYFGPFTIEGAGEEASTTTSSSSSTSAGSATATATAGGVGGGIITPGHNSTMASMTGTAASAGTGSPISRNATMSSATLSATQHSTSGAESTSGAGFQSTSTSRPTSTNAAAALATGGSAAVVLLGALAALI